MGRVEQQDYSFNLLFVRRFWRLHSIFYPGLVSVNTGVLALLFLTAGIEQFLAYNVGIMSGQFFNVLGSKDWEAFKTVSIKNIIIILAIAVTKSARVLTTRVLIVGWRKAVGQVLHRLYLSKNNYYRLNVLDLSCDNPDQRMTSDVSSLVESYSSIISNLIVLPFTICYYTWDAYSRGGWLGPTGMYGIFLVSTVVNKLLMKPVVQLTVEKERREGDFRFKHLQVRCNAESLAFHGSAAFEQSKMNGKLSDVCGAQQRLFYRNFYIDISVNIFAYIGAIASYLVIAIPIFAGEYDSLTGPELSEQISQNAFVCIYLVFQLTQLVEITGTVAGMAGSTHRVCELIEVLVGYEQKAKVLEKMPSCADGSDSEDTQPIVTVVEDMEPIVRVVSAVSQSESIANTCNQKERDEQAFNQSEKIDAEAAHSSNQLLSGDVLIEFRGFGLSAPTKEFADMQALVSNLNLKVSRGRSLLVMGPSSSGKSSLLRTLRGLWTPSLGEVIVNSDFSHGFFYLPQKPFFTNGTLREQIFYPLMVVGCLVDQAQEVRILDLLQILGLAGLLDRCEGLDAEPRWNWYDVLSPGEQQRLAFARMLFHKPTLAVLDEATSAVSQDVEGVMYSRCLEEKVTLLSVGHRDSLKQYHAQVLYLTGEDGGWSLQDIEA